MRCGCPKAVAGLKARPRRGQWLVLCRSCNDWADCKDLTEAEERQRRIERFRGASAIERRAMIREVQYPLASQLVAAARARAAEDRERSGAPVEAAPLDMGSITSARELRRRRRRAGAV
jgi:hypothetical protein